MADANITNRWTLLAFAASRGKMQTGTSRDKDGQEFKSCSFTHPVTGSRTYVGFSSKLGVLSAKEISPQKNELQVVEYMGQNGNPVYKLCKQGESTWDDVEL